MSYLFDPKETTQKAVAHWIAEPASIPEEEHVRHCTGGYVPIVDEDYPHGANLRCPVCEYRKSLRGLEHELRHSGITERYLHKSWDDLEPVDPFPRLKEATQNIDRVITEGHSLLLHGPASGGKTQAAMLIVRAALGAGYRARIANLGYLAMEIREGYSGERGASESLTVRELSSADLLVLDDLGAGETGEAKIERRLLYFVTEARQNAGRPTVITTNLGPKELSDVIGARILNRLQPLSIIHVNHGKNFREPDPKKGLW